MIKLIRRTGSNLPSEGSGPRYRRATRVVAALVFVVSFGYTCFSHRAVMYAIPHWSLVYGWPFVYLERATGDRDVPWWPLWRDCSEFSVGMLAANLCVAAGIALVIALSLRWHLARVNRPWQFTLGEMLFGITAAACVMALCVHYRNEYHVEQQSVAKLEAWGWKVYRGDPITPKWLERLAEDLRIPMPQSLRRATAVTWDRTGRVDRTPPTMSKQAGRQRKVDSVLQHTASEIAGLEYCESIGVYDSSLTDTGIRSLFQQARGFRAVFLEGSPELTDAALAWIVEACPDVESLYLYWVKLSPAGIDHLATMRNLGFVQIEGEDSVPRDLRDDLLNIPSLPRLWAPDEWSDDEEFEERAERSALFYSYASGGISDLEASLSGDEQNPVLSIRLRNPEYMSPLVVDRQLVFLPAIVLRDKQGRVIPFEEIRALEKPPVSVLSSRMTTLKENEEIERVIHLRKGFKRFVTGITSESEAGNSEGAKLTAYEAICRMPADACPAEIEVWYKPTYFFGDGFAAYMDGINTAQFYRGPMRVTVPYRFEKDTAAQTKAGNRPPSALIRGNISP
jgi:hypothetical protein